MDAWLSNDYLVDHPTQKAEFETYYTGYLNGKFLPHTQESYDHNLRPAIKIIAATPNPKLFRVLDVGAGTGTDALFFSLLGCDVTGIEVQQKLFEVAQVRHSICRERFDSNAHCQFFHQSLFDFEDNQGFNLIYLHHVFHHLEPRDRVVDKIAQLLRPGGFLVISEVNFYNPIVQLFLARERYREFKNPFKTIITIKDENGTDILWGHERITPAFRLSQQFRKRQIRKHDVKYFKFLPNRRNLKAGQAAKGFVGNQFTLRLEKWLYQHLPVFLRRMVAFQYVYVGQASLGACRE